MFGLGFWEIAIVLGVALVIFGPSKLPELARSLGRGLREFRKATEDFKSTIDAELHAPEPKPPLRERPPEPAKLPDTVARSAPFGPGAGVVEAQVEPDAGPNAAPAPAPADTAAEAQARGLADAGRVLEAPASEKA